jgi:hypothetical protein
VRSDIPAAFHGSCLRCGSPIRGLPRLIGAPALSGSAMVGLRGVGRGAVPKGIPANLVRCSRRARN